MPKRPQSMDELIYYTSRTIDDGEITVWVFKQLCPKCGKGFMGKPIDEKGKVKVRAKEYVCPECGYNVEKKEYEESLMAGVDYTCPECKHKAETQILFKRKLIDRVQTLRVKCEKCNANIDVTKKMKKPKR